jgi:hypothetical protein
MRFSVLAMSSPLQPLTNTPSAPSRHHSTPSRVYIPSTDRIKHTDTKRGLGCVSDCYSSTLLRLVAPLFRCRTDSSLANILLLTELSTRSTMDSQLRVSAVVFISVLCVCLLVPADCAAVHSRVSADILGGNYRLFEVGVTVHRRYYVR